MFFVIAGPLTLLAAFDYLSLGNKWFSSISDVEKNKPAFPDNAYSELKHQFQTVEPSHVTFWLSANLFHSCVLKIKNLGHSAKAIKRQSESAEWWADVNKQRKNSTSPLPRNSKNETDKLNEHLLDSLRGKDWNRWTKQSSLAWAQYKKTLKKLQANESNRKLALTLEYLLCNRNSRWFW